MLESGGVICNLGPRSTIGRGRPAEDLGLDPRFGLILVADLGVSYARLTIHDLGQQLLSDFETRLEVSDGPESVLGTVIDCFKRMLPRL
jgi:hypothetical protein